LLVSCILPTRSRSTIRLEVIRRTCSSSTEAARGNPVCKRADMTQVPSSTRAIVVERIIPSLKRPAPTCRFDGSSNFKVWAEAALTHGSQIGSYLTTPLAAHAFSIPRLDRWMTIYVLLSKIAGDLDTSNPYEFAIS
jgi:hypothetical protein